MVSYGAFVNIFDSNRHKWSEQFEFLSTLPGVGHVELWVEDVPDATAIRFLRRLIHDQGLVTIIHAPFVGVSLASHDEDLRLASVARVLRASSFGESIGAKVITCHSGAVGAWVDQRRGLRILSRSLAEIAERSTLQVTIENMPSKSGGSRELVTSVADLQAVTQAVPQIGETLDVGHCIQNGEAPDQAFAELAGVTRNIHIHDGVTNGRAHQRLGSGQLELGKLMGIMRREGYAGFASLETLGQEDTCASWQLLSRAMGVMADA